MTPTDPTTLTENFHYESPTHTYDIKWSSVGDPSNAPLIFIHGTPWSSRVWSSLALSLSHHFHVYIFDNPGFGASPVERLLFNAVFNPVTEVQRLDADLARQTAAYVALFRFWQKGWEGRKPYIIAHDHGGLMSLLGKILHGCEYKSLCLVDVVALGPFGQPLYKSVAEHPGWFEELPDMAFEGILESYIRNAAYTELARDVMDMLKEPWLREGGKKGFVRQLCQANCRSTEEVESRYGEVGRSVPVKIIWGVEDNWISHDTADSLGKALGAEEVVKIDGAGHLIMYDQPSQFGVEIGTWVTAVEGRSRTERREARDEVRR